LFLQDLDQGSSADESGGEFYEEEYRDDSDDEEDLGLKYARNFEMMRDARMRTSSCSSVESGDSGISAGSDMSLISNLSEQLRKTSIDISIEEMNQQNGSSFNTTPSGGNSSTSGSNHSSRGSGISAESAAQSSGSVGSSSSSSVKMDRPIQPNFGFEQEYVDDYLFLDDSEKMNPLKSASAIFEGEGSNSAIAADDLMSAAAAAAEAAQSPTMSPTNTSPQATSPGTAAASSIFHPSSEAFPLDFGTPNHTCQRCGEVVTESVRHICRMGALGGHTQQVQLPWGDAQAHGQTQGQGT
jgi:hypothetical protein